MGVAPSATAGATAKETVAAAEGRTIAALALTCTPSRFYQRCLDVLSVLAEQAGWSLVAQHARDENRYDDVLPLEALHPRGFIALHYNLYPIARRLHERGHRTVIVGSPPVSVTPEVPCVMGDHEEVATCARLLEQGHRRIAYGASTPSRIDAVEPLWKRRAQEQAAREGLRQRVDAGRAGLRSWAADPALAGQYFRQPDSQPPSSPGMTAGRMPCSASSTRRGSMFEELSLVGYDDAGRRRRACPPSTSTSRSSLRYALDLLSRPHSPATQSVVVVPTLVRRHPARRPHAKKGHRTMQPRVFPPTAGLHAHRAARRDRHHCHSGRHPLPRLRPGPREARQIGYTFPTPGGSGWRCSECVQDYDETVVPNNNQVAAVPRAQQKNWCDILRPTIKNNQVFICPRLQPTLRSAGRPPRDLRRARDGMRDQQRLLQQPDARDDLREGPRGWLSKPVQTGRN